MVGFHLVGAMLSDVGRVRSLNEDAVAFVVPASGRTTRDSDALLLVADGVGGLSAGEIASAMAVEVVRQVFFALKGAPPKRLRAAFLAANEAILDYGKQNPQDSGLGTTCTAIAVQGDKAWLAHVGDSRAYLLRAGELKQLSEDQSLVAKMVRDGVMTIEEAKTSVHNNIILQALGSKAEVEPEIWSEPLMLAPDDRIILCTDGLHGLLADETIASIAGSLPPSAACEALVQRALDAGGHDNVSVGVFRVDGASTGPIDMERRHTRQIPAFRDSAIASEDMKRDTRSMLSSTRRS